MTEPSGKIVDAATVGDAIWNMASRGKNLKDEHYHDVITQILGKADTGNNGTNGKVDKTGTLMLNFPKP